MKKNFENLNSNLSLDSIRKNFPVFRRMRNGKPPIYFDNACTTLVPFQVLNAITEYYTDYPGCGGSRSSHWFSDEVTARINGDPKREIEGARNIIKNFINAGSEKEIIFTSNASHAINIIALGFPFRQGDIVLLTDKEHNSNLVPWLRLQDQGIINIDYMESGKDDLFDLDAFKRRLENNCVRFVSMAYTSNLTGYTIPAKEIIKIAHSFGAKVLLDAAQTAPHRVIDVKDLDVDFLVFSIHKMCGPRGVGILYGKEDFLEQKITGENNSNNVIEPVLLGGGVVYDTTYKGYRLLDPPDRFEVGVQNYEGQIAAGAAVEYLQSIGIDNISSWENKLNDFLTKQLLERYGDAGWFKILGPRDAGNRGGILSFEVKRPNAVGISEELSTRNNIMIRNGVFCAHSYFNKLYGEGWIRPKLPSEHRMIYRVSLYFYNTMEECHIFLDTLHKIFQERCYI